MEVLAPMPRSPEFHFTPTITSSPTPFGEPFSYHHHYTSAPSSPTRAAAAMYSHFSFDFSFNSINPPEISTADKLFEKGKIRPLLHLPLIAATSCSPQSGDRGRQKASAVSSSGNRTRESRSLSPLRNHSFFIKNSTFTPSSSSAAATAGGSRKWRLKDLLLFRSASEGRATGRGTKDPLRKYTLLSSFSSFSSKSKKKGEEEEEEGSKCGSFRSTESGGGSMRRGGRPPASAHEMHYTANRAAAGEMRKKTPLPYQGHGLFGCFQFNPAIRSITKGFSSFS